MSISFLPLFQEAPSAARDARFRRCTYGEKGDGSDNGAIVGRGKAGVHLADGAGLV